MTTYTSWALPATTPMNSRNRVSDLGIIMVLNACLNACSSGSPAVLSPGASPVAQAAVTAYGTLAIRIPPKTPAANGIRKIAYISPGTTRAALFIDGAATPAGSAATCTASVSSGAGCTLTWSTSVSVPAAHSFAVEIDNGTTVLAENKASYALHFGNNALAVLTLKGVAAAGTLSGESCATSSCSGTLTLADGAANTIVNTTSPLATGFDNGPLTFASTNAVAGAVTAGGTLTQPSAAGTAAYTVTCTASTGIFLTSLTPSSGTGSGDITSAELTGRILAYPATITYAPNTYNCSAGPTISNSPTFTEYTVPTSSSQPAGITSGPDGNLWFTEYTGQNVAKITTTGTFTAFAVSTPSGPYGITSGPDGNLWYSEWDSSRIGKITTTGTLTRYPTPTSSSNPTGITTGPDGNLWFAEDLMDRIGKVTTSGTFTEYTTPTRPSSPNGIVAGPDGNLWFTENYSGKIGKVTTSGTFTEYNVPTSSSGPQYITAGPDGNLWFTESSGNKIGKVTTSGVFTEYTVPTTASEPTGITAGPDGNLWFTENGGNKLGVVTTSGQITEYTIPTSNSAPWGITVGPDGNLWFTERTGNKIGKLVR
jgi:streptogramin lyase